MGRSVKFPGISTIPQDTIGCELSLETKETIELLTQATASATEAVERLQL